MASRLQRELSLWADFNTLDEHRRFKASLRFSETPERPRQGEWVRLHDDEGNAVMGVVDEVRGMIVHVRPEMTTWSTSEIAIGSPFVADAAFEQATASMTEGNKTADASELQVA